jgi:integrase
MATFKICVFEHQKRGDGKFPVSIRVYWKGESAYIGTEFYVTLQQINRKTLRLEGGRIKKVFELRDTYILNELNSRIKVYENLKAQKLGYSIEAYTARELVAYFSREAAPGSDGSIDFVEFSRRYCDRLTSAGRKKTASTLLTPLNAMVDLCNGRQRIAVTEITVSMLKDFEAFLRQKRTLKRVNQFGRITVTERPGLSDAGIHDYMTAIRILFNAAMDQYNDEDHGNIRIRHYPFRKYKITKSRAPEQRVLSMEQIRAIFAQNDGILEQKRAQLARDVFILSFCLAGTNLADLYHADASCYSGGRFSYERQKTRGRRQDRAFISMAVPPEAEVFFQKYRDPEGKKVFSFARMYTTHDNFETAINKGLVFVAKACNIPALTSYYARFSFATIARNDCGVSRDDIDLALNHVDQALKITDGYIKKDWSIVDRTIRAVLDRVQ